MDVSTYDFPSSAEGKAIPYGVYDRLFAVKRTLYPGGHVW
jgi:hypothetical protein